MANRKPLILVSAYIKDDILDEVIAGTRPKIDYLELSKKINGEIISYNIYKNNNFLKMYRKFENSISFDILLAIKAFNNKDKVSIFFSTSEKVGFPLSLLLYISNCKVPHIMIGHQLSKKNKKFIYKFVNIFSSIDKILCLCEAQVKFLMEKLKIENRKIEFVYDKVDNIFFNPNSNCEGEYILSLGKENRDYSTLFKAIKNLSVPTKIVASSLWNKKKEKFYDENQNSSLTVYSNCTFIKLRELYSKAFFVIVPLIAVDYAAGVNVILESMAMGKAVIVSKSQGILDYVEDEITCLLVEPENVNDLSEKINFLLNNPSVTRKMGENGRKKIEKDINIDIYIEKLSKIIKEFN